MTYLELREKARQLPEKPGCYLMKDKNGEIIYVGKAKVLRNRVSSYFSSYENHSLKTQKLISRIFDFETVIAPSEFEALLLENTLIKKHMPQYNILLRDDKGYPFVKMTVGPYPNFEIASQKEGQGRFFGPYGGRGAANAAIDVVRDIFSLPTCTRRFPRDIGKARPCLSYDMKKCCGVCTGKVSEEEYAELMHQASSVLEGKVKELMTGLEAEMNEAAEELEFERAAVLRDRLAALRRMKKKQNVAGIATGEADLIAFASDGTRGCLTLLSCTEGNLSGKQNVFFDGAAEQDEQEIVLSFIKQYYPRLEKAPPAICLGFYPEDAKELEKLLSPLAGGKCHISAPKKGEMHRLLSLALKNSQAELALKTSWEKKTVAMHTELGDLLSIDPPDNIEACDISHTAGQDPVAAITVFAGGKPKKNRWRRMKIKSAEGGDDTASLREAMLRRLRRGVEGDDAFLPLPGLILADGGIGACRAIVSAVNELGLQIPVFGMVKDDKHRTRALISPDGKETGLTARPALFGFVGDIQERTHNYAVQYHHDVHDRRSRVSGLDSIPGIGQTRRELLINRFGSIDGIRKATVAQLSAVVPKNIALNIKKYFSEEEEQ